MLEMNTIKYVEIHLIGQASFVKGKHVKLVNFKGESMLLISVDIEVVLNLKCANKCTNK